MLSIQSGMTIEFQPKIAWIKIWQMPTADPNILYVPGYCLFIHAFFNCIDCFIALFAHTSMAETKSLSKIVALIPTIFMLNWFDGTIKCSDQKTEMKWINLIFSLI